MLTQQQPTASETPAAAPQPRALDDLIAYFEGTTSRCGTRRSAS